MDFSKLFEICPHDLPQSEALLRTTDDFVEEPWRTLLCPQCGFEYTHVDTVTIIPASRQRSVSLSGRGEDDFSYVNIDHTDERGRWGGRRHSMIIRIDCENGCTTYLELAQHKGNTFTTLRAGTPNTDDEQ